MDHFADRLLAACRRKGAPICVGLDPVLERLPGAVRQGASPTDAHAAAAALLEFSRGVLHAVAGTVPAVKPQSACFERYLWPGVQALHQVIAEARAMGLIVILDAKRGDIGISADHYAASQLADTAYTDLANPPGPDAITVSGYLGPDTLKPFIDVAQAQGKGIFTLVRTSNPQSDAIQNHPLADGRTVAQMVADEVAKLGAAPGTPGALGQSSYSLVGAVVGATKPADAADLRRRMPRQIFLVPGYGAQGGKADDVRACFNPDGQGAIITASRSVLFAYEKADTCDWTTPIAAAAEQMKREIAAILA